MSTVRLVMAGPKRQARASFAPGEGRRPPALLLSFPYYELYYEVMHYSFYRDWALDSGAFTALTTGKPVDIVQYIDLCQKLIETDPTLSEIYALDVIGDWRATIKNAETMWKAGIPAIPTYHNGAPEHVLYTLANEYPKIAVGGIAGRARRKERFGWAEQVFARVWPKAIHGFGVGDPDLVMLVPWHSVDHSTWFTSPSLFNRWPNLDNARLGLRGGKIELRAVVDFYLDVEERAQSYWKRDLESLPPLPTLREQTKCQTTQQPAAQ